MIIAIICDCDDTLAPDTTAQLLQACGIDPVSFYKNEAGRLVAEGYDPSVAYLNKILERIPSLTKSRIAEIGGTLRLYPGVPKFFQDLKAEVKKEYGGHGISLQAFIITGGIKDLISARLGATVDRIWGSNFGYDSNGQIAHIKNVVSFTEKTRFLYNIQKGLIGEAYDNQPYAVNMFLRRENRPVPFKNMIYIGDGPSDIPCMSVIETFGEQWGRAIGILSTSEPSKTWALAHGRRASCTVPPDFRKSKPAYITIREAVFSIAKRIKEEITSPYPKY